MERCNFILKNGRQCLKNAVSGTKFCNIHKSDGQTSVQKEDERHICGICLEEDFIEKLFRFEPCNHRFHLACIELLTKKECPACRCVPINIPNEIDEKILQNNTNWTRELQEEDEATVRELRARYVTRIPTPREEIELAKEVLRKSGIPLRFLPSKIDIDYPSSGPRPPPGTLAKIIIHKAFQSFYIAVSSLNEEDFESLSDSDDEDDDDDFEKEDKKIGESENPVHITINSI